jgi:hypothetical protein
VGDLLALGELGRASLVGLADVLGDGKLLLSELGKVLLVGLGLVLGLLDSGVGIGGGVLSDGLLLVLLGNGLSGVLVGKLGVAVLSAPTVSYLLVVIAKSC